eukprot:9085-Heterococcus_DN1.PRE.1
MELSFDGYPRTPPPQRYCTASLPIGIQQETSYMLNCYHLFFATYASHTYSPEHTTGATTRLQRSVSSPTRSEAGQSSPKAAHRSDELALDGAVTMNARRYRYIYNMLRPLANECCQCALSLLNCNAVCLMLAACNRSRVPPDQSLDPSHPQIKGDILRMIAQYLHNERYAPTTLRRHLLPTGYLSASCKCLACSSNETPTNIATYLLYDADTLQVSWCYKMKLIRKQLNSRIDDHRSKDCVKQYLRVTGSQHHN